MRGYPKCSNGCVGSGWRSRWRSPWWWCSASASGCTSTWTATSARTSPSASRAPTTTRSRPSARRSAAAPPAAAPAAARGAASGCRPAAATAAPQPPRPRGHTVQRGAAAAPPAAPPAAVAGSWTDFRGPARDGVYRQRAIAATWPAGGPRLLWKQPVGEGHASFVDRARRRLHDRAAPRPRGGRRLRRRHRPRTLDERLGRALLGIDGRRRPAGDADLRRRHPLRARRGWRAARAAGRLRHARVAHQHPRRRRRREPAVGHVGGAPDRRRQGDRAARRPRRVDGRLRRLDRPGGVEVARRSAGLRLADAGDARRPPPDRDHHRRPRHRRVGRRRRAAVELSLGDGQRDQHRAADRDRAVAALPLVRLRQGRRGDRADRRTATGCGRPRSGSTRG